MAHVDFEKVNREALRYSLAILQRWLPDGKVAGREYRARNPKRHDRRTGSFSVNMHTGQWADFATGDKGRDLSSLAAYLFDLKQGDAARQLARMIGMGENHG